MVGYVCLGERDFDRGLATCEERLASMGGFHEGLAGDRDGISRPIRLRDIDARKPNASCGDA